jgi:hypothetical protein
MVKVRKVTPTIAMASKGALLLGGDRYPATITAKSVDALFPRLIEVKGNPDVMQLAMMQSRLQLEMFGVKFWVSVAGYRKDIEAVLVRSEPFFRALPECLAVQKLSTAA